MFQFKPESYSKVFKRFYINFPVPSLIMPSIAMKNQLGGSLEGPLISLYNSSSFLWKSGKIEGSVYAFSGEKL